MHLGISGPRGLARALKTTGRESQMPYFKPFCLADESDSKRFGVRVGTAVRRRTRTVFWGGRRGARKSLLIDESARLTELRAAHYDTFRWKPQVLGIIGCVYASHTRLNARLTELLRVTVGDYGVFRSPSGISPCEWCETLRVQLAPHASIPEAGIPAQGSVKDRHRYRRYAAGSGGSISCLRST